MAGNYSTYLNVGTLTKLGEFDSYGFVINFRYTAEINTDIYWGSQWTFQHYYDFPWFGQIACFEFKRNVNEIFTIKYVPGIGVYITRIEDFSLPWFCIDNAVDLQFGNLEITPSLKILLRKEITMFNVGLAVGFGSLR